ncbi:MAG: exonuclease SbcCD subunit D C-terminal domain-containing protein [Desulfuromonadaceae bacterium]|nr:exonuclease SbcCD subunit D C-terminal domain-containing protein [Desulfuromonadaceae bacterium]
MKILHTSDWHLGRSLYGRKRYAEFEAFLNWLAQTIEDEEIDALLVAGDVFDTSTPSNRAQELYYRFLCRVSTSCCRHVVIIGGNHDSPSFLNAPKELLRALNVHVIGSMTETVADEVIVLKKNPLVTQMDADNVEAIVCAVPYLRDKDIRTVEPGETIDDKNRKLVEGLQKHYEEVVTLAEETRNNLLKTTQSTNKNIPIIAMGHLFTAGGKTVDGDGVRELYVGSLAHVGDDVFPPSIDYLALGHLHVPQAVSGAEHMRYSGSPIPMGYGEATQEKSVVLIEFNQQISSSDSDSSYKKINLREPAQSAEKKCSHPPSKITLKKVPCFQPLVRIVGSLDAIRARLEELKQEESNAWLEIEYTGNDIIGNLQEIVAEALADSPMEIRRIKNRRVTDRIISKIAEDETLDDLDDKDVFIRCLDAFTVPDEDREELMACYVEAIKGLVEEDVNAE